MAVKRVLTRLLRLRELEEELSRVELESAVGQRSRIERELETARARQAQGRRRFVAEAGNGETVGWMAALVQMEQARTHGDRIEGSLAAAEAEVARQRQEFMERRVDREQVETLLDGAHREAEIEAGRRAQQMLDDWYGRREKKAARL